jgi:hypothetical protein
MLQKRFFPFVAILSTLSLFSLCGLSIAAAGSAGSPSKTSPVQTPKSQYQEKVKPNLPDLVVDKFEVAVIKPGEPNVDGKIYDHKRLFYVWYVRNGGNAVSNPTTLKVTCTKEQAGSSGPCPPGLTKNYDIVTLWPRPEEISGCQVIWNSPSVPAPEEGVTYKFTAVVNPSPRTVKEITYENNTLESQYPRKLYLQASQFHKIVEMEKRAKRGVFTSVSPEAKTKLNVGSKITIESVATQPAPLKPDVPFTLILKFVNTGNVSVNAGQQYVLSCRVISGGTNCPLPSGTKTIHQSMSPGAIYNAKYAGITGPSGTYELTVKLLSAKQGDVTKAFNVIINPKKTLRQIPGPALPDKKRPPVPTPL